MSVVWVAIGVVLGFGLVTGLWSLLRPRSWGVRHGSARGFVSRVMEGK